MKIKIKTTYWKETNPTTWAQRYNKQNIINLIFTIGAIITFYTYQVHTLLLSTYLIITIIYIIISISYDRNRKEIEELQNKESEKKWTTQKAKQEK